MYRRIVPVFLFLAPVYLFAQNRLTPELLWQLGRVTGSWYFKDGKYVLYSVTTPDIVENQTSKKTYMVPVDGGTAVETLRPIAF
jgi:hypothetical protein